MDVMIVPEDPTLDQHILKPIVTQIFDDLGQPANVQVLHDPHLRGVDQALDVEIIRDEVIDVYPMVDLFLVMVDRDCDRRGNEAKASHLEESIDSDLFVCLAWEEVEVWMLYLHRSKLNSRTGASFQEVRDSCDPKDDFADPLLAELGWTTTVGKGRKKAMRELGESWQGLTTVCDELADFRTKLDGHLG